MSASEKISINFHYQGVEYDLTLVKGGKSEHSVIMNGVAYAVLGNKALLKTACEILNSVPLNSVSSSKELRKRLSKIRDLSFPLAMKAHDVGIRAVEKFVKTRSHVERLKDQRAHTKSGSAGRAKEASLNTQIETHENRLEELRSNPQVKIKEAFDTLTKDLKDHAAKNLKDGALLVQVVGVSGAEKPIAFGKRSVEDSQPVAVDGNTIGRTGSGAKLWAGLLTNILTKKHGQYIAMDDGLGKFAPEEALRKFGRIDSDGKTTVDPELAKEISVEGLIGMMAGLEYEQPVPIRLPESTLDQFMRGDEIRPGAIHMLYDPRDRINFYTNNISLIAYPIEKAYKKVLAEQLMKDHQLDENQTLRELSPQLESFRENLQEEIRSAEDEIHSIRQLGAEDDVVAPYARRLALLRMDLQKLSIPESALDLTLKDLMECQSAYTSPPHRAYIYDMIDLFLMPSGNHQVDYAEIMKRELLGPMGMDQSGFRDIDGTQMDVTYENESTGQDASMAPPHAHPLGYGAGFGSTTLNDASKLAQGLADPRGLVGKDNKTVLLTREDLDDFFRPHGHYEGWGLGGAELSCGGKIVDKGGSINQDQYSFWVDRESGIGVIVMCNCGRRPDEILNAFKEKVEQIRYPQSTPIIKEKEGTPLGIPLDHFFKHPLENEQVQKLFEGSRGRIALLFDDETAQKGIIHWSGTPLEVEKQKDGTFRVTTPGRFHNVVIKKVHGHQTKADYLAVGDTSFKEIDVNHLPSQSQLERVQKEFFSKFSGKYMNKEHPEWGTLQFGILTDGKGNQFLGAGEGKGALVPQSIVKVEPNAILFNGHDRQPPDKIFRFIRESEAASWRLQVLDYVSKQVIEERPKSSNSR